MRGERISASLVVLLLLFGVWVLNVEGVDIPSTTVNSATWQYFNLDLTTAPQSAGPVRAIIYFTVSGGSSVALYAQYDTQPTTTANIGFNVTEMDATSGKYFGSITLAKRTGSLYFGVYNSGAGAVTILAGGRYYFAKEETLPDPFSLKGGDYTIQSGTATLFSLNVPEATSLALSFSLKFTTLGAFQSEATNLLLRRDALPNFINSDVWGVIDYQPNNFGVNGQGQQLAGWECWFRKGILSGDYYISLYNSESSDQTVSILAYLTQIFELRETSAQKVTAVANKNVVLLYLTDPSQNTVLDVVTTAPAGEKPSVMVQTDVCPTSRTYKSWSYQFPSANGITYTTDIQPVTEYCIVVRNPNPTGSYTVSVTPLQSPRTAPPDTNSKVTTDEYGDGVEPIEVAGIVVGVFIGIFSLIFFGWFLLILLQMDREAWVARDPLQWGGEGGSL